MLFKIIFRCILLIPISMQCLQTMKLRKIILKLWNGIGICKVETLLLFNYKFINDVTSLCRKVSKILHKENDMF